MSDDPFPLILRIRRWVAGILFLTAGRLYEAYDVWLDAAPPRNRLRRAEWDAAISDMHAEEEPRHEPCDKCQTPLQPR